MKTGDAKPGWKTSENVNTWGLVALLGTLTQGQSELVAAMAALGIGILGGCYALSRGLKKKAEVQ